MENTDNTSAKARIDALRQEIEKHERLYRIENAPIISDDDFDVLVRELAALELQFPEFADKSSPTQAVGSDTSGNFVSVEHLSPMKSLDNVFDSSELADFDIRLHKTLGIDDKFKYCIEPKIDGAGVSAIYENGKLVRLLTRGNGTKGDDITRNAFVIRNLPTQLKGDNIPSLLDRSYCDGFFGIGGIHLFCSIKQRPRCAVAGLWIDTGELESSKKMFDVLFQHKDEIESKMSVPIIWDRKNKKRACSIELLLDDIDFANTESWATIASFHAEKTKELADVIVYPFKDELLNL